MWINKDDVVSYKNQNLTVVSVDGLYSVASNILITLKDQLGQELKMNYINDFYPKYNSGLITSVMVKEKPNRGY